ncbi:la-related protein 6B-like [Phoenix dactylifera]|uniref:La-related protein 6B-like n=1 Tax=Phoenix dactylifera TaxID=42345 RepID=A0A8B7BZ28_PHODC|nr:la-related protein 6B-like [Phoenix dactylifera]
MEQETLEIPEDGIASTAAGSLTTFSKTVEMAQETLENPEDRIASAADRTAQEPAGPSLSRTASSSRGLNADAPEFVPRAPPPGQHPRVVKIRHAPPPPPVIHAFHPPPPPPPDMSPPFISPVPSLGPFEYFGGGGAVAGGGFGEHEAVQTAVDVDHVPPPGREGLPEEVVQKITKQVEYYFSDVNLATTEHLMRFISRDPEGFVPISVIASFKKIKALVHNNPLLAAALQTSSKLVVSNDGKKVRRLQPFTEGDVEELQSRIVVAENLPEDHCYQNLMKVFSAVGSVKTIRTCYPQNPIGNLNGTTAAANRSSKLEVLFYNKLHAFVEYETIEDAENAVTELNDERNWRTGLRVRILSKCMTKHGPGQGRKIGHEGDANGDEDEIATTNQPTEKQVEDPSQSFEDLMEHVGEENFNDKDGMARRSKGRGRGGKGRGRGQYHHNDNRNGGHAIGTPPSSHLIHAVQQPAVSKQPPGPRMPDGTRGFTMGRGKPLNPINTD